MTTNRLLQSLPSLLGNKPKLFSNADLQELQEILAPVENNPSENADQLLKDWCKTRPQIRDALRILADNDRELKKVVPSQPSQFPRVTNFFQELRQKVKDELSKRTDSTKSDSVKPDQNQNNE